MPILQCEISDGFATLTLNRPDKKNALSSPLRDTIVNTLDQLESHPDVNAILLTANGETFCAGFDLLEIAEGDMEEIFAHATDYHYRFYHCPLPIVAAINGPALAGGFDLAAMCDVRIDVIGAHFSQPQVKMGIPAAYELMAAVLPESVARNLCLTGNPVTAEEMVTYGFLDQVTEANDLLPAAQKVAAQLANNKASRRMKAQMISNQPRLFEVE